MKKSVGVLFLSMAISPVFAQISQKKNVPEVVLSNFQKQYPEVPEAKWEKDGENYEVEFSNKGLEESVVYDAAGMVLETELEIKTNQLPKAVSEYVAANYKGQKIKEASKITDAKGTVTYEAEVKDADLIFDSNGLFLRIEKEEHDEKSKKD